MSQAEPQVTSADLETKWQALGKAVTEKAERKVLGVSVITLGLVALGAVALGTAFWLGRASKRTGEAREEPARREGAAPVVRYQERRASPIVAALTSLVETAIKAAVEALMSGLKGKAEGEQGK